MLRKYGAEIGRMGSFGMKEDEPSQASMALRPTYQQSSRGEGHPPCHGMCVHHAPLFLMHFQEYQIVWVVDSENYTFYVL